MTQGAARRFDQAIPGPVTADVKIARRRGVDLQLLQPTKRLPRNGHGLQAAGRMPPEYQGILLNGIFAAARKASVSAFTQPPLGS